MSRYTHAAWRAVLHQLTFGLLFYKRPQLRWRDGAGPGFQQQAISSLTSWQHRNASAFVSPTACCPFHHLFNSLLDPVLKCKAADRRSNTLDCALTRIASTLRESVGGGNKDGADRAVSACPRSFCTYAYSCRALEPSPVRNAFASHITVDSWSGRYEIDKFGRPLTTQA